MRAADGTVLLSPTDLTKHLACAHLTTLDLAYATGASGAQPDIPDEMLELIFAKGLDHEYTYRDKLREQGRWMREIETRFDTAGRRVAEQETLAAMREGVDVIYQASFFDGRWGGQADFLVRAERAGDLGSWSYDIADTKLARRLKVPALLQMAAYAERLAVLQGAEPRVLVVITGDGAEHAWRLVDVQAYARRARDRLAAAVDQPKPTQAVPVEHCSQCRWASHCAAGWAASDDLSLVAGMRSGHREALRLQGIDTLTDLAGARVKDIGGISRGVRDRLSAQARLQLVERTSGEPAYELLTPAPGQGLLRLPSPSQGDVYLDFEGDPFADEGRGREYLAGLWDRDGRFTAWWAHDQIQEGELVSELLTHLVERLDAAPEMHIYHYAPYEVSALKRMTGRHAVGERDLDRLLRGERFVDLYAVVRQGVRISKDSYSIKKLEAFYWGGSRGGQGRAVKDAMSSVIAYERWIAEHDPAILAQIADYNTDDVRSTHDLHAWLEGLRAELESVHGPFARPPGSSDQPSAEQSEAEQAEEALAARLRLSGLPLMAGLVGWHRRESRPAYWEFFRGESLDTEQLVDDPGFVGGLAAPERVGSVARSYIHRYTFPPQEGRLKVGDQAHDVDTHEAAGVVTAFDAAAGVVEVKRGMRNPALTPRGLGPSGPMRTDVLAGALNRLGESMLRGNRSCGRALVDRLVPDDLRTQLGEEPADTVARVGRELASRYRGRVLAVQGPPGSGKTYTASRLIAALLDDGRTVGVTANSHSVIGHLLRTVGRPALQKCKPEQHCGLEDVQQTDDNADVVRALKDGSHRLVGGTSWLWARPDMAGAVDVLLVDEAGQFSLANAAAVAQTARSLVLLGDPQQLASPTQAEHPDGAGVSALQHLIGASDTIAADRGIFLDTTRRMHPQVTAFVGSLSYDDRLASVAGLDRQLVRAPDRRLAVRGEGCALPDGAGLRFVPVHHQGCSSASEQEAVVVAGLYTELLGCTVSDADGVPRPLGAEDVLVVAPYNAHVALLRSALPSDARVGTVDAFQGQEAAVVIYSLASSSEADAPRGVRFLYDVHRLNVAVSRARSMCILLASPTLLDAPVRDPEQLKAVNALCRYVELAAG